MTLQSSPKKVVVLALPGARELDLASVLDVFTQANCQLAPNPACFFTGQATRLSSVSCLRQSLR
jgi:hypothetical protein